MAGGWITDAAVTVAGEDAGLVALALLTYAATRPDSEPRARVLADRFERAFLAYSHELCDRLEAGA